MPLESEVESGLGDGGGHRTSGPTEHWSGQQTTPHSEHDRSKVIDARRREYNEMVLLVSNVTNGSRIIRILGVLILR